MYNHAPKNYECPICQLVVGKDNQFTKLSDIIYQDKNVTSFVASKWWPNNPGHVMVIPNKHYENLYDIPDDTLCKVYSFVKKIAIVIKKSYKCDGISTRQHNEPAGDQDTWHFHVHVFPRYKNDKLYQLHLQTRWTTLEDRYPYVMKLRNTLKSLS